MEVKLNLINIRRFVMILEYLECFLEESIYLFETFEDILEEVQLLLERAINISTF